jgi:hypothetical protein
MWRLSAFCCPLQLVKGDAGFVDEMFKGQS